MKKWCALLLKIIAYILLVGGFLGGFVFRAHIYYLAMVIGLLLSGSIKWPGWDRIKNLDPEKDTRTDIFGMTVFDFKEEDTKGELESPDMLTCDDCGAEYNPKDYSQDAPEWICPQCTKVLPKSNIE
jgi:hypothetical protein